jgi:hypothetical protein
LRRGQASWRRCLFSCWLRRRLESRLLHYRRLSRLRLHLQLDLLLLWLLLHGLKLAGWLSVLLLELLGREARLRNGLRLLLLLLLLLGIASHLGLDGDGITGRLGGQIGRLLGESLLLRWCLLLGIHVLLLGERGLLARPGSVATAQKGARAGEHDAGQAPDGNRRWGVGREMFDGLVKRGGARVENGVVSPARRFPLQSHPQPQLTPQPDHLTTTGPTIRFHLSINVVLSSRLRNGGGREEPFSRVGPCKGTSAYQSAARQLTFRQAFQEVAKGEQTAAAVESQLDALESLIDELLADAEAVDRPEHPADDKARTGGRPTAAGDSSAGGNSKS